MHAFTFTRTHSLTPIHSRPFTHAHSLAPSQEHFGFGREGIQKRSLSHQHLAILDQLNFKSTVEKFDSKDKQLMAQMLIQKVRRVGGEMNHSVNVPTLDTIDDD